MFITFFQFGTSPLFYQRNAFWGDDVQSTSVEVATKTQGVKSKGDNKFLFCIRAAETEVDMKILKAECISINQK